MADVEARVAQILDESRVALNKGASVGLKTGDSATLWRIVEIKDPETKEHLDTIRLDVASLEIVRVTPNVSIAQLPTSSGLSILGFNRPTRRLTSRSRIDTADDIRVEVGDEVTVHLLSAAE